jgi:pimeloyl-ACP methyl ester carboxylesterase
MERKSVDIGDAVALEVVVAGDGLVTVVFENGLGTPLELWDAVASRIAQSTRTVRYDRRSAPHSGALGARTAAAMASDLERLLAVLDLKPPYVLVGHSWGGVVARTFIHQHPTAVGGLVLVDATHEIINSPALSLLPLMYRVMNVAARFEAGRRWLRRQLCPPAASTAYRTRFEQRLNNPTLWALDIRTARAEGAGIRTALAALRQNSPNLADIPTHVLTAGGASGPNLKSVQRVHEAWRASVARASCATYTNIPGSSHLMPIDAADAVVQAIVGVVGALPRRGSQPLPPVPAARI